MKKGSMILVLIFYLSSCQSQSRSDVLSRKVEVLSINIDNPQCLKFSHQFKDQTFIPLETNNYCIFSTARQVIINDNNIIVVPQSPEFTVYIFDKTGRFVNSIYKAGRGPDEYVALYGITVNNELKQISFFDPGNKCFITMDYKGKFLKKIKVNNFHGTYFMFQPETGKIIMDLQGGSIYSSTNIRSFYNILIFDPQNNQTKTFLPISIWDPFSSPKSLFQFNGEIYYKPIFMDTIYMIANDTPVPKYVLDFGKHSKPKEIFTTTDKSKYIELKEKLGMVLNNYDFKETDRFIYSSHQERKNIYLFHFLDKLSKKSTVYNRFINDYASQIEEKPFLPYDFPVALWSETLVFSLEPQKLLKDFNSLKNKLSPDQLKKYLSDNPDFARMIASITETDNPVLMFCKVK